MTKVAQANIFLLKFIIGRFNDWYTKCVLKSCATQGFYVGGNTLCRESVNSSFFGVNIAFYCSPSPYCRWTFVAFFSHLNPCQSIESIFTLISLPCI